jgi:hypothetical protein
MPAMPAVVRRWRWVLAVAMPSIAMRAIAAIPSVRRRRRGVVAVATVVRRRRRVVTRVASTVAPPVAAPVAPSVAAPGRGAVAAMPTVCGGRGGRGAARDGATAAVLRGPDLGAVVHLAIEGATPQALACCLEGDATAIPSGELSCGDLPCGDPSGDPSGSAAPLVRGAAQQPVGSSEEAARVAERCGRQEAPFSTTASTWTPWVRSSSRITSDLAKSRAARTFERVRRG